MISSKKRKGCSFLSDVSMFRREMKNKAVPFVTSHGEFTNKVEPEVSVRK